MTASIHNAPPLKELEFPRGGRDESGWPSIERLRIEFTLELDIFSLDATGLSPFLKALPFFSRDIVFLQEVAVFPRDQLGRLEMDDLVARKNANLLSTLGPFDQRGKIGLRFFDRQGFHDGYSIVLPPLQIKSGKN